MHSMLATAPLRWSNMSEVLWLAFVMAWMELECHQFHEMKLL